MTTTTFDDEADGEDRVTNAVVLDLDSARRQHRDQQPPTDTDTDDHDHDEDDVDRESVDDDAPGIGGPVDPDDDDLIPASLRTAAAARRPILPAWMGSKAGIWATCKWSWRQSRYWMAFHTVRLPKYTAKTAWWSGVGAARLIPGLCYWASAEAGNFALRQAAANANDPKTWITLDTKRQRQAVARWWILAGGTAASVLVAFGLATGLIPASWGWTGLAASIPLLTRAGRPADKSVTDRVRESKAYRKLTAELVRRGLMSLQLAAINSAVAKDPNAISFPVEIHRDGPGHLAIIDLPYGVEAGDVIARRGRLASGLRLPLDQVWPEASPGHTGRLALWVGHEPASQMRQPAWPLLKDGQVNVFAPIPFATTPRLEPVIGLLMYRNWLFGGQPGSGKTFALRLLVLAAALDPRCEIRGYEFKGVGDFAMLEPVLSEYGNGFDDDTLAKCAAMLDWLYQECERRSKRIAFYAKAGKAPENKVTEELASLKGSGLHPLIVFIDEVQQLFSHPKLGKAAGETAEAVIKLGRALGVVLLLGTQIPDKDSLPTGITRNINTRFCLSVADQTANDMILGTSAYKNGYRATVFEPVVEAGWGILAGLGKPGARKSFAVDGDDADKVVARAIALRTDAGTLPAEVEQREGGPTFDLLADVLAVWPDGADKAWNDTLTSALAELRPEVYQGWKSAQLTAALKPYPQVNVADVGRRIEGKAVTQRGIARADVAAAITERDRKRSAG